MGLYMLGIGAGLFAPIGGLSSICPTGKSVGVEFRCNRKAYPLVGVKLITFSNSKIELDVFELTLGAKIKIYKKIFANLGGGGYYVRERLNKGFENETGLCSYFGLCIPFLLTEGITLSPEISYSTVPRGISLGLNLSCFM